MCPENFSILADGKQVNVSWPEPIFYDAQGSDIKVTSTFGRNRTALSWGEHRVEYTATNTYNNLTTFCVFHINVFRKSYCLHGKYVHVSIIVFTKLCYTNMQYRGYDKCIYRFPSPQIISSYNYRSFFCITTYQVCRSTNSHLYWLRICRNKRLV